MSRTNLLWISVWFLHKFLFHTVTPYYLSCYSIYYPYPNRVHVPSPNNKPTESLRVCLPLTESLTHPQIVFTFDPFPTVKVITFIVHVSVPLHFVIPYKFTNIQPSVETLRLKHIQPSSLTPTFSSIPVQGPSGNFRVILQIS